MNPFEEIFAVWQGIVRDGLTPGDAERKRRLDQAFQVATPSLLAAAKRFARSIPDPEDVALDACLKFYRRMANRNGRRELVFESADAVRGYFFAVLNRHISAEKKRQTKKPVMDFNDALFQVNRILPGIGEWSLSATDGSLSGAEATWEEMSELLDDRSLSLLNRDLLTAIRNAPDSAQRRRLRNQGAFIQLWAHENGVELDDGARHSHQVFVSLAQQCAAELGSREEDLARVLSCRSGGQIRDARSARHRGSMVIVARMRRNHARAEAENPSTEPADFRARKLVRRALWCFQGGERVDFIR